MVTVFFFKLINHQRALLTNGTERSAARYVKSRLVKVLFFFSTWAWRPNDNIRPTNAQHSLRCAAW